MCVCVCVCVCVYIYIYILYKEYITYCIIGKQLNNTYSHIYLY